MNSRGIRRRRYLLRMISFSLLAALATIALKFTAYLVTGSVGLLSDAAESLINLLAAIVAFAVVLWSTRPADEEHAHGHEKADYLSAGFEGALIFLASLFIIYSAVSRLFHPVEITDIEIGLAVALLASGINLLVARLLLSAGKKEGSLTLEADGHHLMSDVWTSLGVVVGVALAWLSGWSFIDSLVALLVSLHILRVGYQLIAKSLDGLMDKAIDKEEREKIEKILLRYSQEGISFHALRTRSSGSRAFISFHLLVPGHWSIKKGHDLGEKIEAEIRKSVSGASIVVHLEPSEDPLSFQDKELDRH